MTNSDNQTKKLSGVMDSCLNLDSPKSFFLFAGAGSGKTRALVEAMQMFRKKYGQDFRLSARPPGRLPSLHIPMLHVTK